MHDNFYREIMERSPVGFALHKIICEDNGQPSDYIFLEVNAAFERLTGLDRSNIIGQQVTVVLPGTRTGEFDWVAFYGEIALTGVPQEIDQFSEQLGRWYRVNAYSPEKYYFITHVTDISKEMSQLTALRHNEEKLRVTLLSVGDGFISTDIQGQVEIMNPVAEKLTGWSQADAFGKPLAQVFNIINEYTREKCIDPVQTALATGQAVTLANHTILIARDGSERPIEDSAAPIKGKQGDVHGVVLVFRDFSDKKAHQDKIEHLSFHDALTGLYNRRFYEEEVRRLDTERNWPISVVMGDVNGLKLVNDAFGHDVGDDLLHTAAQAILKACRADDIVARWGGDEFIILLPKTGRDEAREIVNRIKTRYSQEYVNGIQISVSFGWDTRTSQDEDIMTIMKNAEDNMYRSKTLESQSIRGNFVKTIINALYEKNPREEQHSKRVSELSIRLGIAMGLPDEIQKKLQGVGLLHDIGKIAIDQSILNKVGGLTEQEWSEIKRHPEIGYRILSSSYMQELGEYILSQHEKWDGSGYPQGLMGEGIPLIARIITIADAYDAMTGLRTYRRSLSEEETVSEIVKYAGTQFDPDIARVFVENVLGRPWQA